MTGTQRAFLMLLLAVGLAASLLVLSQRVAVERGNATVGVAVDFLEVQHAAGATGEPLEVTMRQFKNAGATHLAVTEDSLASLVERGEANIFTRPEGAHVWLATMYRLQQMVAALSSRFPGKYARSQGDDGDGWLDMPAAAVAVPQTGVGYSREALDAARAVGLTIVARPHWEGIHTAPAVERAIELAGQAGAEIVVFSGDQVVGFPGMVGDTARAITANGMTFGFIELAPQMGAASLASALELAVVRVHSITEPEMRTISHPRAIERFVKSARERNVRLFYLRLFPGDERGPVRASAEYVAAIRDGLAARGMTTGRPVPFAPLRIPPWQLALVRVALCGALLWIIQSLFGLRAGWFWALALLTVVGGGAAMMVATDMVRSVCALGAGVVFPTLAVGWAARYLARPTEDERPSLGAALPRQIVAFAGVSAITIIGGLVVAALLSDSAYLMKIAQFRGVKFAQFLPLMVVALVWLARCMPWYVEAGSGESRAEWPAVWAGLRGALAQPIVYWHAVAAMVGLAVLAMLMMRSGNEAGGAILPGELQLRALLDKILIVRPRTKEVFLGHPLMMLALLLMLRGTPRALWVALALGAIGQVSLLNSFCHLHTPLTLTLLRVFNGLWVGALAGIVLCVVWEFVSRRMAPASPEPPPVEEQ